MMGKPSYRLWLAFSLAIVASLPSYFSYAAGKPSPSPSQSSTPNSMATTSPSQGKSAQNSATPSSKSQGNSANGNGNSSQSQTPSGNSSQPKPSQAASPSNSISNSNSNSNASTTTNSNTTTSTSSTAKPAAPSSMPIQVAKKSSNTKLNPSSTNSFNANSKADKALALPTSKSQDCVQPKVPKVIDPQNICSDFIVVFEPGLSRTNSNKLISDSGAKLLRTFSHIFNGALVNGPLAKMQALANNPNVLVVEDDLDVKATSLQSLSPWGLDRLDQQALPLSSTFDDMDIQGANTYSYVVDTGIDASNSDLEGRVVPGYTAVLDGNGSADCNGHGTHVSGIIGGKTYGVAKKTFLIPVRVLDCSGSGTYSSVISGLDWIAANYRAGDAAVVNMSLGGPASSTLDGAIKNLIAKGISVVVAAGNSNADACNYSPSRVVEAITVGATSSDDNRASYSNFGTCLDVFAPGSSITSTWLGSSSTATLSGTSMAVPHVAGVVVRFVSQYAGLTPAQISNSIKTSSTKNAVISAGLGSPNQLAFLYVLPDTTTITPIDSSPKFKKVIPRGKKK